VPRGAPLAARLGRTAEVVPGRAVDYVVLRP